MKIHIEGEKVDQLFNHIMQLALKGGESYAEEMVKSLIAVSKVADEVSVVSGDAAQAIESVIDSEASKVVPITPDAVENV